MKPNQLCSHDFSQCFQTETPRQLTTVATVHVIDRNPTPLPDKNENNQTSSSTNQTTIKVVSMSHTL